MNQAIHGCAPRYGIMPQSRSSAAYLMPVIIIFSLLTSASSETSFEEPSVASLRESLKKEEARIQVEQAALDKQLAREKSVLVRLQKLDKNIHGRTRELKIYSRNIAKYTRQMKKAAKRKQNLEKRLKTSQTYMTQRLRSLQKIHSSSDMFHLLVLSSDMATLHRRARFLRLMASLDSRIIHSLRTDRKRMESEQIALEEKMEKVNLYREAARKKRKRLKRSRLRKARLRKNIRASIRLKRQRIKEKKRASRNLKSLLRQLEERSMSSSSGFALMRGAFHWPVCGHITHPFGTYTHPELGIQMQNDGIDIEAESGTDVTCIFKGTVAYVDWFEGYGKMVVVDHGGGYFSVYAHLSEWAVISGQTVTSNTIVGQVGDTGSFEGSFLHFEILKIAHAGKVKYRKPLNPKIWLSKSKQTGDKK